MFVTSYSAGTNLNFWPPMDAWTMRPLCGRVKTATPFLYFAAFDAPLGALRFSILAPLDFVGDQLLGKLGVPTLAAVLSFAMPTEPWRGKGGLWMWMGLGGLAAGLAATQNSLAGPDSVMPVAIALALLGPISMQRITRHLSSWPGSSRR